MIKHLTNKRIRFKFNKYSDRLYHAKMGCEPEEGERSHGSVMLANMKETNNIKLHYEGLKHGNGLQTDIRNNFLGNKVLEERNITDTINVTYRNILDEHVENNKGKNNSTTVPNRYEIMNKSNFGKIFKDHSFTSEASLENIPIRIFKSKFLPMTDEKNLCSTHVLFTHLRKMIDWSKRIDFSDIKNHIPNYALQDKIDTNKKKRFLAAILQIILHILSLT